MNNIFESIKSFLNNKNLSNWDVILTSIISAFGVFLIIWFFKSPVRSIINKINKCKPIEYFKKMLRFYSGKINLNDIIEIEDKQSKGIFLTKKELSVLEKFQEPMKKYLKEHPEFLNMTFGIPEIKINDLQQYIIPKNLNK